MNTSLSIWFSALLLILVSPYSNASSSMSIAQANKLPLFDGVCGKQEWESATKLALPASISIYLMYDEDYLFVCAKGKENDYTVIDLYIKHPESEKLHNLHASAQLGERILTGEEWGETEFWGLEGWGGFWVPFAGTEETDEGSRTKFLEGSHREIQIKRTKFAGDTWIMMISISAVNHNDEYGAEFSYPKDAVNTDVSTFGIFSFSKAKGRRK